MFFAGPVDFGPWFFLFFVIIAIIVAIPVLAVGFFIFVVSRKIFANNANKTTPAQDTRSPWLFGFIILSSLSFLTFYLNNTQKAPYWVVLYIVINSLLVMRMSRVWAIRAAIVVTLTLTLFVYNHYPQYSGRSCDNYPTFLECRKPRYSF